MTLDYLSIISDETSRIVSDYERDRYCSCSMVRPLDSRDGRPTPGGHASCGGRSGPRTTRCRLRPVCRAPNATERFP